MALLNLFTENNKKLAHGLLIILAAVRFIISQNWKPTTKITFGVWYKH